MCTLIFGWNALRAGSLLLAANRDEDPARPSDGPTLLRGFPRVAGGRDRLAGGTWLAIRDRRCVVAVLNRRDLPLDPASPRPSRGLLAIAVAAAGDGHPDHCAAAARLLMTADLYAPCSLVIAGPEAAWIVNHPGGAPPRLERAEPGWHAIAHQDFDDPTEPRIAWLRRELDGFAPHSEEAAERRLGELLASHGGSTPAVCLHEGRARTVSTSRLWLGDRARFAHGEGHACTTTLLDHTGLLSNL